MNSNNLRIDITKHTYMFEQHPFVRRTIKHGVNPYVFLHFRKKCTDQGLRLPTYVSVGACQLDRDDIEVKAGMEEGAERSEWKRSVLLSLNQIQYIVLVKFDLLLASN